jgi:2-iminoacetate synthase ThiH
MHVTDAELIDLATSHDIISIGMLADDRRRQRHGTRTTFVRVADVAADPGAPVRSPAAAGELRIVGVPASRAAAVERVREVAAAAHGAPVSAFSLADLEQLAAVEGVTLRALLEELSAAGLELVAEAPFDRLADPRRSIEEVNIAGLALARLTVHQSASPDPLPLLKAVAELQRGVGVVRVFAPLPRRVNPAAPTTGYEDVRRVALARLVVDNVPSIQVDWSLYGPKLAQVALTVGADDIDAVSAEDETTEGRRRAPLEEIRRNIRAAGQEPVERNGRFEVLRPLEPLGAVPSEAEGRHAQDERAR